MATESQDAGAARGADPITRGLLGWLAASAQPEGASSTTGAEAADGSDTRQGNEFLPQLPDPAVLLALLGAWHGRGVQVGFPELTGVRP